MRDSARRAEELRRPTRVGRPPLEDTANQLEVVLRADDEPARIADHARRVAEIGVGAVPDGITAKIVMVQNVERIHSNPEISAPNAGEVLAEPKIDRPNTRPFLKKLFLRDGKRCANPACKRRLDLRVRAVHYVEIANPPRAATKQLLTAAEYLTYPE